MKSEANADSPWTSILFIGPCFQNDFCGTEFMSHFLNESFLESESRMCARFRKICLLMMMMMIKKTPNSTQGFITKRRQQMFDVTNITVILTVPVKDEILDLNWTPISLKIIYLCSHGSRRGHLKDLDLSQVVRLWWLDGGHVWAHCISNWWPIASYFIMKKEQSCYFYASPAYKTESAPVHVWSPQTDWLWGVDEWWTTCQCWIKKRDENASGHASAFFRLETAVWSLDEVSDLIKNPLTEAFRCSWSHFVRFSQF